MSIRRKRQIILFLSLLFVITFGYYIYNNINLIDKTHLSPPEIKALLKRSGTGYYLQPCNCIKHKTKTGESLPNMRLKSTCSDEGDWLGPGQKIVSYVLHHDKNEGADPFDMFVNGIIPNIYQVKQLYPGWILRFYTDSNLTQDFCDFACMDQVMWCDIRLLTSIGNLSNVNFRMWRFMPIGDPNVDIFVSRDIDSLICEREREAVADWEISTKPFHVTRDSGTHHGKTILAGMWGAKNYLLDSNISVGLRDQFIKNGTNNTYFSLDEDLLNELLFQKYESNILAHDSYSCQKWSKSAVPYPQQRKNRFTRIALSLRVSHKFEAPPCPEECRPSYGKDWIYC